MWYDANLKILKNIAVQSEGSKSWKKEVDLISHNDKEPKYIIREWAPDYTKMGKGIP